MVSLLDIDRDTGRGGGGGLLGLDMPRIQQPDERVVDQGQALAETYNAVTDAMRRQQASGGGVLDAAPIWPKDNPVGTERTPGPELRTAQPGFRPAAMLGGGLWGEERPASQAAVDRFGEGSRWLYDQTSLLVGNSPTAGVPRTLMAASRRTPLTPVPAGRGAPAEAPPGIRAYHGSPHSFDRFDSSRIGTGEGAQAYGHGLYFAENEGVARQYRDNLSPLASAARGNTDAAGLAARALQGASPEEAIAGLQARLEMPHIKRGIETGDAEMVSFRDNIAQAIELIRNPAQRGSMYEAQINADPEHFLHWDKPLSEQSPVVQKVMADRFDLRPGGVKEREAYLASLPNGGGAAAGSRQQPQQ